MQNHRTPPVRPGAAGDITGFVVSRDGTPIGYTRLGSGPGVVILHGSMESAHSHRRLAEGLADLFTVYLPDRRGHGQSGPAGDDFGIDREVEDLEAVMGAAESTRVFGVSSSGLIALEAARRLPWIERAAVYEPFVTQDATTTEWLERFDAEMAEGRTAAALITSMFGLGLAPPFLKLFPRRLLVSMTDRAMCAEDRRAQPDEETMRKLAPTLHLEGVVLAAGQGRIESFADVAARVLLMGGSKGLRSLGPARDLLERVLPNCERIEFQGLDHGGSSDVSRTNAHGKPEIVAPEVRRFFAAP
jgi:pimeloyl-ACP methyl ester carboxylesterase